MNDTFQIQIASIGDRTRVVRVTGRLDAHNASTLLQQCQQGKSADGHLVLNLSGVRFIASSGVGALLSLAEEFNQGSGSLRIAAPSQAVDSVVRLLNLDQFLLIHATEREALEAVTAA